MHLLLIGGSTIECYSIGSVALGPTGPIPHNFCKLLRLSHDLIDVPETRNHPTPDDPGGEFEALLRAAIAATRRYLSLSEYDDIDDAASEAMAAFIEKRVKGEPVDDPEAFVKLVARRKALDIVRDKVSWRSYVAEEVAWLRQNNPQGELMDVEAVEREIMRAVEGLPEQQAACFTLHHVRGMSEAEIASELGLAPGTVKTHLNRARAAIRRELQ